jgi:hypothetical protein
VAEHTVTVRETVTRQPARDFGDLQLLAVPDAAPVDMVYREKLVAVLTTARADATVFLETGFALGSVLPSHSRVLMFQVL